MGNTSDYNQNGSAERPSEHINLGILAHVDAGKTTLSEGMLYLSGAIRDMGRVDYGNAFLDTYELERQRGIFQNRRCLPGRERRLLSLIRRDMWIFPRKWSVRCRCWTARFL